MEYCNVPGCDGKVRVTNSQYNSNGDRVRYVRCDTCHTRTKLVGEARLPREQTVKKEWWDGITASQLKARLAVLNNSDNQPNTQRALQPEEVMVAASAEAAPPPAVHMWATRDLIDEFRDMAKYSYKERFNEVLFREALVKRGSVPSLAYIANLYNE